VRLTFLFSLVVGGLLVLSGCGPSRYYDYDTAAKRYEYERELRAEQRAARRAKARKAARAKARRSRERRLARAKRSDRAAEPRRMPAATTYVRSNDDSRSNAANALQKKQPVADVPLPRRRSRLSLRRRQRRRVQRRRARLMSWQNHPNRLKRPRRRLGANRLQTAIVCCEQVLLRRPPNASSSPGNPMRRRRAWGRAGRSIQSTSRRLRSLA